MYADFSEYSAHCDERRAFISGVNGSAGTSARSHIACHPCADASRGAGLALVTLDNAYLFTDGRYFLQAEQQLDKCATLHDMSTLQSLTFEQKLDIDEAGPPRYAARS